MSALFLPQMDPHIITSGRQILSTQLVKQVSRTYAPLCPSVMLFSSIYPAKCPPLPCPRSFQWRLLITPMNPAFSHPSAPFVLTSPSQARGGVVHMPDKPEAGDALLTWLGAFLGIGTTGLVYDVMNGAIQGGGKVRSYLILQFAWFLLPSHVRPLPPSCFKVSANP